MSPRLPRRAFASLFSLTTLMVVSSAPAQESPSPAEAPARTEKDEPPAEAPALAPVATEKSAPPAPPPTADEPSVPPRTAPRMAIDDGEPAARDERATISKAARIGKPRYHDGLIARLATGPGLFRAEASTAPAYRSFSGGAAHLELSLGGEVGRGVFIGGTYLRSMIFSLDAKDETGPPAPALRDVTFTLSAGAVFAEMYPDPAAGFHFLGGVGYGTLLTGRDRFDVPSGIVLTAGAGYEWFVTDQLSLGALARFTYGSFSVTEVPGTTTDVRVFVPTVMVGVSYN